MNNIKQFDFPMNKDGGCIPLPASNKKLAEIALEISEKSRVSSSHLLKEK